MRITRKTIEKYLKEELEQLLAANNVDEEIISALIGYSNFKPRQNKIIEELKRKKIINSKGNLNIKLKI